MNEEEMDQYQNWLLRKNERTENFVVHDGIWACQDGELVQATPGYTSGS